jgi:glutathione S-transferase
MAEEKLMKLLGSDRSPYVRKVQIAFEEKGIPYEHVGASPSDSASGIGAANPLSKIPTLVRDDGKGLYDSSVIVEYLDGLKASPKLIPEAFVDRIEVKRWEALGDGIVDATVEIMHDRRRPPAQQLGPEGDAKQLKKITAGLAAMEKDLGASLFCYGDTFTLADIGCGVALGYLDRTLPEIEWRKNHPGLARHLEQLGARPSFSKTLVAIS